MRNAVHRHSKKTTNKNALIINRQSQKRNAGNNNDQIYQRFP